MTDNQPDMPELKNCPFCNYIAFLGAEYVEISGSAQQENYAECHSCGVRVYGDTTAVNHDPFIDCRCNIHPSQVQIVSDKWNQRADLCAAVSDAPTDNTPGTLPNEQRTSQPEMTGSSEVDRSERVLIASTDKEREDGLSALDMIFELFEAHCENFDIDMPDDEDGMILLGCKAEVRAALTSPDQSEVIKALVEALRKILWLRPAGDCKNKTIIAMENTAREALALAEKAGK